MKLFLSIFSLHIFLIAIGVFYDHSLSKPKKLTPLIVRTVQLEKTKLAQAQPTNVISPPAPAQKNVAPPQKSPPPPKKIAKSDKKKKATQSNKKNKEANKKNGDLSNNNKEKLRRLAEESLVALNQTGKRSHSAAAPLPSISDSLISFERNYQDELISYLEQLLTLPEDGEVKMQLTLSREGQVHALRITQATSQKNRTYLETTVPTLQLPSFGSCFKQEKTHTFTITLTTTK